MELIDTIDLDRDNGNGELTLRIGIIVDIKVTDYYKEEGNKELNKEINVTFKAMNKSFKDRYILESCEIRDMAIYIVIYNMFNNDEIRHSVEQEILKYENVRSLLPYYKEVLYIINYGSNEYSFRAVLEYEKHRDYIDILNEEERIAEQISNF